MTKASELADKYEKQTRARDRGAADGRVDFPPFEQTALTETELEVTLLAQDDFDELVTDWREATSKDVAAFRQTFTQVPVQLARTIDDFKINCENTLLNEERSLIASFVKKDSRDAEYRYFKAFHRLKRDARPERPLILAFSLLIAAVAIESVINAIFFKDVLKNALVGGVVVAGMISLTNAMFGFALGVLPFRYLQHRYRLHIMWAAPLIVVLLGAILSFNLMVAHLRDVMDKSVLDKAATVGTPKVHDVLGPLLKNPLGVTGFESWLLAIVGVCIALYAAYKAQSTFDPYPGFGKVFLLKQEANDEYDSELADAKTPIDLLATAYVADAKGEFTEVDKLLEKCASQLDTIDVRAKAFQATCSSVVDACNSTLSLYRQQNSAVRNPSMSTPPYFGTRWKPNDEATAIVASLLADISLLRPAVTTRGTELKAAHEKLLLSVPKEIGALLSDAAMRDRLRRIETAGSAKAAEEARKLEEERAKLKTA